jgi:hypothetical protein
MIGYDTPCVNFRALSLNGCYADAQTEPKEPVVNFKAILVCFLIVIIMAPTLVLGIAESPWFFLILFALILIFPFVLAPSVDKTTGETKNADFLARALFITALVFGGFVLALGLLVAPGFFLLMLLVCAPLIWLAFRPES